MPQTRPPALNGRPGRTLHRHGVRQRSSAGRRRDCSGCATRPPRSARSALTPGRWRPCRASQVPAAGRDHRVPRRLRVRRRGRPRRSGRGRGCAAGSSGTTPPSCPAIIGRALADLPAELRREVVHADDLVALCDPTMSDHDELAIAVAKCAGSTARSSMQDRQMNKAGPRSHGRLGVPGRPARRGRETAWTPSSCRPLTQWRPPAR